MKRRNASPTEIPPDFVKGSAIDSAAWHGKKLVVDLDGGVQCFLQERQGQALHLTFLVKIGWLIFISMSNVRPDTIPLFPANSF